LKERRKSSDFQKLVVAQGGIVNAAHPRDREEEEAILYDMAAIYMVLTRVGHVTVPRQLAVSIDFICHVPDYCADLYRFRRRHELQHLYDLLKLPLRFTLKDGSHVYSETAFLYTIMRLTKDTNVQDLMEKGFGGEKTKWGRVLTTTTDWLLEEHGHRLGTIKPEEVARFPSYARAVEDYVNAKGAGIVAGANRIALFIDCNCVATTRPGGGPTAEGPGAARNDPLLQRAFYNGWKSMNGLKAQTVMAPDGLTIHMWGLCSLRRNDSHVLAVSGVNDLLTSAQSNVHPAPYCVYGDSAYTNMGLLRRSTGVRAVDSPFNSARECVEHSYGEKDILFPYLKCKRKLRIRERNMAPLYFAALFLRNCYTCLYWDKTSERFDIAPPSLGEYLSWD